MCLNPTFNRRRSPISLAHLHATLCYVDSVHYDCYFRQKPRDQDATQNVRDWRHRWGLQAQEKERRPQVPRVTSKPGPTPFAGSLAWVQWFVSSLYAWWLEKYRHFVRETGSGYIPVCPTSRPLGGCQAKKWQTLHIYFFKSCDNQKNMKGMNEAIQLVLNTRYLFLSFRHSISFRPENLLKSAIIGVTLPE